MGLRDRIQFAQARRLYASNPEARRELDEINEAADQYDGITKKDHLALEREVIRKYRKK